MTHIASKLFGRLRAFLRSRRGVSVIEFSIIAPLFTFALLGSLEIGRYVLLHQKMDRVSSSVVDWVAQSLFLTSADLTNIYDGARHVSQPFELDAKGLVIISFITAENATDYRITWQRSGGGTLSETSKFGAEGNLATLPAGITLAAGDYLVTTEVYVKWEPFVFPGLIGSITTYHRSFAQPRQPDAITLQ
jgi:Flp pilus assembly protein TadG